MQTLAVSQEQWVKKIFDSMTLEEKVGHLLCPEDRNYSDADWEALLKEVPLGCIFFEDRKIDKVRSTAALVQKISRIPILVSADMEAGLGCGTQFPNAMGCSATGDPAFLTEKGRISAREARAIGLHWTFAPVIDLAINHNNPETQYRAFGDTPETVRRMAQAFIDGIQENNLMAGTAKHFPGTGIDDRDQHIATAVNPLPFQVWKEVYGKLWKSIIDGGVMTIMAGHISLPDYEGLSATPWAAMPATLNRRLQVDLLRNELGFKGVLVSDAAPMIGFTSRTNTEGAAVENILAGSDVFLFAEPRRDFKLLLDAVKSGRISQTRLDESVLRVLQLKARLGIHEDPFGPAVSPEENAGHQVSARKLSNRSIVIQRGDAALPAPLAAGAKVLTVTVDNLSHKPDLDAVDRELKMRGYLVDHLANPEHKTIAERAGGYDRIFVNIALEIHHPIGMTRLLGQGVMAFWRAFWRDHPGKVVFTSFGCPYHLYELPHLPNMALAWGKCEASQEAAVKVWLKEIEATGICPVRMPGGLV